MIYVPSTQSSAQSMIILLYRMLSQLIALNMIQVSRRILRDCLALPLRCFKDLRRSIFFGSIKTSLPVSERVTPLVLTLSFTLMFSLMGSWTPLLTSMNGKQAHAALLVLPHGIKQQLIWERALVVYDRISRQQTVIAEVAVTGSPKHFAILVATPPMVTVDYTTTRIWRYLKRHVKRRVITRSKLSLEPYSWLLSSWRHHPERVKSTSLSKDVLKSRDTQTHMQERALHEWLIRRGLALNPEQALSIKQVYQNGHIVTALWVKPPRDRQGDSRDVDQTWTSTWIFTHEVDYPHYLSLSPQRLEQVYGGGQESTPTHLTPTTLKLSFIAEAQLKLSCRPSFPDSFTSDQDMILPQMSKLLERLEISELNSALTASSWSYKRGGVLSTFELSPPQGLITVEGQVDENSDFITPPIDHRERLHQLSIPLELVALVLWMMWRLIVTMRRSEVR